jgi:hypothetical protein
MCSSEEGRGREMDPIQYLSILLPHRVLYRKGNPPLGLWALSKLIRDLSLLFTLGITPHFNESCGLVQDVLMLSLGITKHFTNPRNHSISSVYPRDHSAF